MKARFVDGHAVYVYRGPERGFKWLPLDMAPPDGGFMELDMLMALTTQDDEEDKEITSVLEFEDGTRTPFALMVA